MSSHECNERFWIFEDLRTALQAANMPVAVAQDFKERVVEVEKNLAR
jgi:hypothetical protein